MGKKAKRRQRATMNQMNQMVQDQVTDFQGRQVEAQGAVDAQRAEFEAFQFTNPFQKPKTHLEVFKHSLVIFMVEHKTYMLEHKTNLLEWKIYMKVWKTVLKI